MGRKPQPPAQAGGVSSDPVANAPDFKEFALSGAGMDAPVPEPGAPHRPVPVKVRHRSMTFLTRG
ncbi:hypothetical protein [Magnetospirillum moscoviense]|uniref:Uncharacterized protein n=1 Tax=Magnetospirillum moscoviense TaxID=1437059 RepID=A0A178MQ98_9PROT|nr:hypothetical protein [Magnetospirillum moscoviense]OAN50693.1 hypothetical protein A6A05_11855 [Magnetospirillum moscoviense]